MSEGPGTTTSPVVSMLASLVGIVVLIAAVTLVAGAAPLYVKVNLRSLAIFGSGLILGTAFVIVLPEGIEVLGEKSTPTYAGSMVLLGYLILFLLDASMKLYARQSAPRTEFDLSDMRDLDGLDPEAPQTPRAGAASSRSQLLELMSRVDVVTLGMVLHAAADGVSLGAAHSTGSRTLRLTVLLSILAHKAPSSFSFISVLLARHISRPVIKRDLILFAGSTPVAAILTWFVLRNLENDVEYWVATTLLVSAGSFIFVAGHILPVFERSRDIPLLAVSVFVPLLTSLLPE